MNIETLLKTLASDHISIWSDQDKLMVSVPEGGLSAPLREALRMHKIDLLKLLHSGSLTANSSGDTSSTSAPPNLIRPDCSRITPDLLPLITLTQSDIDSIVGRVSGGIANIQDIYALSPLQDGMLFHYLLATVGDPYLVLKQVAFADRAVLDRFLGAVQQVVDRHDILRTAIVWEGLAEPAQVVLRQVSLPVTEIRLDPDAGAGTASEQLTRQFEPHHTRIDLTQAPLLRFVIAQDPDSSRWLLLCMQHHLVSDDSTSDLLHSEVAAILSGRSKTLTAPQPFRNMVAQTRRGAETHEPFFRQILGDIHEPTLPFGLSDVHRDGKGVADCYRQLPQVLNQRLRSQARRLGVSLASLCHLAFGQVLARSSGHEAVVMGTVLSGRMQGGEGANRAAGMSINTLPLRLDLDDASVEQSAQQAHRRLAELLQHEHASLALAQRCSGVAARAPLFSALINYRNSQTQGSTPPDAQGEMSLAFHGIEYLSSQISSNYPVDLSVDDSGDGLGLTARVVVVDSLSPERLCDFMQHALEHLAEALEHTPMMSVRQLEILPGAERKLLLSTWNQTDRPYAADCCIHQLFERQAERTPGAVALLQEEAQLTYAQLNAQANRLAHRLIALGVRPDARVAICADRRPHMIVGLLAILKAGGAYVPLDPAYPSQRLAEILTDAQPVLVLADAASRPALGAGTTGTLPIVSLDELPSDTSEANPDPQVSGLTSSHLAYVIYTSGSTGKPKGVMVQHRSVVNLWTTLEQEVFAGRQFATVGWNAPYQFDASVQMLVQLLSGRRVALLPAAVRTDAVAFLQHLVTHQIDVVDCTPSQLELLLANGLTTRNTSWPRSILVGGEPIDQATWDRLRQESRIEFHNVYGPTECTVDATLATTNGSTGSVTIGRPLANTRIYLLDIHGQPVPIGAVGEIYIGGAGVARGYLNRPELTAERFLEDRFCNELGARMYRTGDLGRYRSDGNIECLGRADQQVKIRGFRIELGEIEVRLSAHPAIRQAVVIVREDIPGDKRLVAYVIAHASLAIEVSELREHLACQLPDYMVPSAFVQMESLPLTSNGKLDRTALPIPEGDALAHRAYEPLQGEIEQLLAGIWSELLSVERVGRHDDFFKLGGHSLLAMRLMQRLRQADLNTQVKVLFDHPILADMATALGGYDEVKVPPNLIRPESTTITPDMLPLITLIQSDIDSIVGRMPGGIANIQDIYALSPLQSGMLFHHLLGTDGDPYLVFKQMVFADRTVLDRFLDAVQQVIDRHDILRTAFVWEGLSEPAQVVLHKVVLPVTEIRLDPDASAGTASEQLAQRFEPRHTRIDLTQAPLLRFVIALDPESPRWVMLCMQHHLVSDYSTFDTLTGEVAAILSGRNLALTSPQRFRNLVAQTRLGAESHEPFFRQKLGDIEEPTLPFGLSDVHQDGKEIVQGRRMLSQDLNDHLREQARRLGVSVASLCHLAFGQVLARCSGRETVVFGTVLSGRMQGGDGADSAAGMFINTLPLRLDLNDASVEQSVRQTHRYLAELLEHEHASLALAQRCSGVAFPAPLFSALLNCRGDRSQGTVTAQVHDQSNSAFQGIEQVGGQEHTNYPFDLSVDDYGDGLGLTVQVVDSLSPERVCDFMQQALEHLAEALEYNPLMPVRQLEILPGAERKLLLHTWNQTDRSYPADRCIHRLFEEQVERTPDAVAVVQDEVQLTYAQLNAQANRLAHRLIAIGVRPDSRVAICVDRRPHMVVGLLAILKAGGAYVPLDPAFPVERLDELLIDAQPVLLLTDSTGRQALGTHTGTLSGLSLDELPYDTPDTNPDPQVLGLMSSHLAYVIYTSGSTGKPKGVMVEHHSVVNLWSALEQTAFAGRQFATVGWNAPYQFDASVKMLAQLLSGRCLVVLPTAVRADTGAFLDYLAVHRIDVVDCTPTQLELFVANGLLSPGARWPQSILVGGEQIGQATWDRLRQDGRIEVHNVYGPTECTVDATLATISGGAATPTIGRPIANTRIYLLDRNNQPVPLGAVGEIYIGGAGVARGYLNRPDLTAERFLQDPFCAEPDARMYRTGDLARYRSDGNIEFLGRADHQLKIRGFRIEPGEIEARLAEHPTIHQAMVIAREDVPGDRRLVAYMIAQAGATLEVSELREHLARQLPDYMVPSAFVQIEALPLTPNGKLDRKAFPAPDGDALAHRVYEPPQGEVEQILAGIWSELLGVECVGRHDHFFELGGHSLFVVRLIERLRQKGLGTDVKFLFTNPTLANLAATVGPSREAVVPPQCITPDTTKLTPELLPLCDLPQAEIDALIGRIPNGIANIQDVYTLSPLQNGILFHYLFATQGDPYLHVTQLLFDDRATLDRYLAAIQQLVDRHNILRTTFHWTGLSAPVQVVSRKAPLTITELELDAQEGSAADQLAQRFSPRHFRIDLTQAPLLRYYIAREPDSSRWQLLELRHQLISDHSTLDVLRDEAARILSGQGDTLSAPQPYRNFVAQFRAVPAELHERYFREQLADITKPTLPFGLDDVRRDGAGVREFHLMLPQALNDRLRAQAHRLDVSLASLCHLAYGLVLARASGQSTVVFGTVLFGRLSAGRGADRAVGLFINTLPLRLDLDDASTLESIRQTHERLAELIQHEHASLALAKQCSSIAAPQPLFSALLNYRHQRISTERNDKDISPFRGVQRLRAEERSSIPFVMSVEDFGDALGLTAAIVDSLDPGQVCQYMQVALESLAQTLESNPRRPVHQLEVLPAGERSLLLESFNQTRTSYPQDSCVHTLFEKQVKRAPKAIALFHDNAALTYAELNAQANVLSHQLIAMGVGPDCCVAICTDRKPHLIAGLLAVLKAGGAFVPLDPTYPTQRLGQILDDARPLLVLLDQAGRDALRQVLPDALPQVDLEQSFDDCVRQRLANPDPVALGLSSRHLAYVVYTSGSTGVPNGVMVEHRGLVNLALAQIGSFGLSPTSRVLQFASIGFDASVSEILMALCSGATLFQPNRLQREAVFECLEQQGISHVTLPPALLQAQPHAVAAATLQTVILAGEAPSVELVRKFAPYAAMFNAYGPTEATVCATTWQRPSDFHGRVVPIGRPIANARIYLLDAHQQPVPRGAVGEMYIGGAGVARGYLNRPKLTAERFLWDPFSDEPDARMYRTGDFARFLEDGNLEFLGRADQQVKIHGFRIEMEDIAAHLVALQSIRDAVVIAREDVPGVKRLVGYLIAEVGAKMEVADLRQYLARRLPDHMVPSAFVQLEAFPLTPNGKLDRTALPAPEGGSLAHGVYEEPHGELERTVAAIWSELLGVERIGRHDDFFGLGGHSLLALQLIERLHGVGLNAQLKSLFEHPTLAAQARGLDPNV